MRRAALVYDEVQSRHILREDHVLQPNRLQLTYELLQSYDAFEDSLLVTPRMADEGELLSFHTQDYVEAVKSLSRGESRFNPATYNFFEDGDNPPYEGMYEVAARVVGASLGAAELVTSGQVDAAFNISGGLHHAAPNYASGFCVFNDVVIAILWLLKKGLRVAYVDIDAHHADGVQNAFYESDQVLKISLHEWGRYLFPGTGGVSEIGKGAGTGYTVNIPFFPYTDDRVYLWAFSQVVPPLVQRFKPDILVTQLGCDAHYLDPLTHLMLTTEAYATVVKELKRLAPKWVALGGGGYDLGVVARVWTLAYGIMTDHNWPDEIPASFREHYGLTRLRDEGQPNIDSRLKEQARPFAERGVEELKRFFGLHHPFPP